MRSVLAPARALSNIREVQTQTLSSLFSLKSQPVQAISIDSPLAPANVIEKLRQRGREWRKSALPDDLKTFRIETLLVKIDGSDFEISWTGDVNPFYNPVVFGTVEARGNGSHIQAGFKLNRRRIVAFVILPLIMVLLGLSPHPTRIWLVLSALMVIAVSILFVRKRTDEPMRTRLIEVLNAAAKSDAAGSSREILRSGESELGSFRAG